MTQPEIYHALRSADRPLTAQQIAITYGHEITKVQDQLRRLLKKGCIERRESYNRTRTYVYWIKEEVNTHGKRKATSEIRQ
jgi:predicted transcriptional regulator